MLILSPDKVLKLGLKQAGFDVDRQKVRRSDSLYRFKTFYGSLPIVLAQVWSDLQTLDNQP